MRLEEAEQPSLAAMAEGVEEVRVPTVRLAAVSPEAREVVAVRLIQEPAALVALTAILEEVLRLVQVVTATTVATLATVAQVQVAQRAVFQLPLTVQMVLHTVVHLP